MPSPALTSRRDGLLAAALLAIFVLHALSESRVKSPSSDEPPHLASGLSYVATRIFRGNLQHPPLLKELSGLSLLMGGIRWPRTPETEHFLHGEIQGQQPEWEIGNQIIAANGPDRVMFWARLPLLLVSCLLGALTYLWGRQMLGGLAALCAVLLYTLDPTILGHSYLVTMDVGLSAFTMLFLFALWNYLRDSTPRRLVLCGLAMGAMLCAKFSAVLVLPAAALLLLAAAIPSDLSKKWLRYGAAFLAMGVVAAVVIEAIYLFPKDPLLYLRGLKRVNADHLPYYRAYMAGELALHFPSYFAVAYLLKEPIASIVLAAAGLGVLIRSKSIPTLGKLFLLIPPAVFFAGTTFLADDIGIRYIMPVLPFAHLLGGLALATLFRMKALWGRIAGTSLCVWLVVAAVGIYPDHLSYFNESACLLRDPLKLGIDGGSRCGIYWLDDSNVDWGQGLIQLKTWLDRNAPGRSVRLANPFEFPGETYGIPHEKAEMKELAGVPLPGLYAVSAHLVARLPVHEHTSDWLRRLPPVAIVGHAFYVYEVRGKTAP